MTRGLALEAPSWWGVRSGWTMGLELCMGWGELALNVVVVARNIENWSPE